MSAGGGPAELAVVLLGGPDVAEPPDRATQDPDDRRAARAVDPGEAALAAAVAERMAGAGRSTVVAVDSGLHRASALGLDVDVVVGDMDSVRTDLLEAAAAAGAQVVRHPEVKDHTDVALALSWVSSQGIDAALVVGSQLGRLDHLLATTLVLGAPEHAALEIEAWMGPARLHVVHPGRTTALVGAPGELVSLFALGGRAVGVTTTGLLYPLHDDVLVPGSTGGTSNELARTAASVTVAEGTVLAVLPGERGTHLKRGLVTRRDKATADPGAFDASDGTAGEAAGEEERHPPSRRPPHAARDRADPPERTGWSGEPAAPRVARRGDLPEGAPRSGEPSEPPSHNPRTGGNP